MDFKELCQILEIPEVEPQMEPPSPTSGQPGDIHTFLASPSSTSKRRRDDDTQPHRSGLVTTPTAELSNQEEMLLGDILDWSLDSSCSGYEGDREEDSEAEKDGDSSMTSINLQPLADGENKTEHCRALSSDDDSFCEAESDGRKHCPGQEPSASSADLHSSGYSSVQSVSPSSTCSSASPVTRTFRAFTASLGTATVSAQPGFRLLVPMQRPRGVSSRQVKRKNVAAHSGGEVEREEDCSANAGFLSL